jgi:hypothetical protein
MSSAKQSWQVRLIRVLFRVLALLTIDLVVQIVNIEIMNLQKYIAPVYVTLLGMLLVVLMFYFLISYIERWTTALLKYVVELGKTFRYRKTAVLTIIVALQFCAFFAYYRLWFGKWIGFSDLPKVFSAPILR